MVKSKKGALSIAASFVVAVALVGSPLLASASSGREESEALPVSLLDGAGKPAQLTERAARIVSMARASGSLRSPALRNEAARMVVPRSDAEHDLVVVSDDSGTCIIGVVDAGGSVSCGPNIGTVPALGSSDLIGPGIWRVAFLLPDGVERFEIHLRGGAVRDVPVRGNIVDEVVRGELQAYKWRDASGAAHAIDASASQSVGRGRPASSD